MIVAWVTMKLYSWPLWLPAYHSFPVVPLVHVSPILAVILFCSFFVAAVCVFIKPMHTYFLLVLWATEMLAMLGDELRWQPWQYQFLFVVLAVFINRRKPQLAINGIILILASTYFFSGLQKMNAGFLQNVWLRLVLVRFLHCSNAVYGSRLLRYAGLAIPVFEMASGLFLLLNRQHKIFAWLPIFMHLFVFVFVGPFGIHYNMIVLPWNAAMAISIYLIFIKHNTVFSFTGLVHKANIVIAVAWMALPVAGVFGYWDKFFSSSVYSGNNPHLIIFITPASGVPPELLPYVHHSQTGYNGLHTYLNVLDWCLAELNVPVPPEARIYQSIETSFQQKYSYLKPVFLYQ